MSLPVVSDADFDREVLKSNLPVFVKFTATWCNPCKAIAPIVESMAAEYAGEMRFLDVDLDTSPDAAATHGIRGVPTMMIFRDGKVVARDTGGQTRTRLAEMIDSALESDAK